MVCSYCDGKAKPAHGNCRTCPALHMDRFAEQAAEGQAKSALCALIDSGMPGAGQALSAIDQAYDVIKTTSRWKSMSKNEKKEFFTRTVVGNLMG